MAFPTFFMENTLPVFAVLKVMFNPYADNSTNPSKSINHDADDCSIPKSHPGPRCATRDVQDALHTVRMGGCRSRDSHLQREGWCRSHGSSAAGDG